MPHAAVIAVVDFLAWTTQVSRFAKKETAIEESYLNRRKSWKDGYRVLSTKTGMVSPRVPILKTALAIYYLIKTFIFMEVHIVFSTKTTDKQGITDQYTVD